MFVFHSTIICFIFILFLNFAIGLFKQCNHKIDMKIGEKLYVNSPYYPAEYPVGSSCRYVFKAPQDYELKFSCNIKINAPYAATRCLNDIFYFNREGSELLTGSEYFCGNGKMERKSFLNQAVISYMSTPYNKRILTSAIKEVEQIPVKEITEKTPTTTTSTLKPLKVQQLTKEMNKINITKAITTTTTTQIPITQSFFNSTPVKTTSLPVTEIDQYVDKTMGNSFAYVVALLSNKIDLKVLAKKTNTTTKTNKSSLRRTTLRPTSVFVNKTDFLPTNTWRNGSFAQHKISLQRVAKLIVSQDYTTTTTTTTTQQLLTTSLPTSSTSASRLTYDTRLSEGDGSSGSGGSGGGGGGSFSCLVEVLKSQCECGWSSTVKIAGVSGVAGINEFPSMAGIMTIRNQKIFCGATIIHHRYLLSAAHCYTTPETSRPEFLRAVVGEHDLSTVLESLYTRYYDLITIIIHEQFHATTTKVYNDIAILKTHLPIEWNRSVGPACLPFYTLVQGEGNIPYAGQRVETAGWGTTSFGGQQSTLLLKTSLDVISHAECQKVIRNLPFGAFCTYTPGRDTCQYDSGGALYIRNERMYAVGIVSYGFACATNRPSVNTRITSHLKWIRNKTPDAKYCTK